MPSMVNPPYLEEAIALNCKNFSELKVMGPFDVLFASTVVKFLANLKVLSLRCLVIVKDALFLILDNLPNLEVLNISHSLFIEGSLLPLLMLEKIIKKLDKIILEKAARLHEFLTCTEHSCIMCHCTRSDEGFMRWYKYEEGFLEIREHWLVSEDAISDLKKENEHVIFKVRKLEEQLKISKEVFDKVKTELKHCQESFRNVEQHFANER
ncbi:F-box/LRR-repeat protein At3g48880-like [Pistacia vera]|uniref:F-box/LRR-repeat protein At3g48880-like n=1 Tax=Pistacia vera TaxID=55513 RepID=UPI001263B36F|nr:F-box/LRR-repeat protein At3g48880-like [Pistacia vera]